jgi:hypothetical protein
MIRTIKFSPSHIKMNKIKSHLDPEILKELNQKWGKPIYAQCPHCQKLVILSKKTGRPKKFSPVFR